MNCAIVMRATGPPDVLRAESGPLADLAYSEIRIRTIAAAVNHTDLEIRAGMWPIRRESPFPYVPGVEVVGEVVEVGSAAEAVRIGERVVTMMQGLAGVRALRPGGYQEYVTVDADAVAPVPDAVEPLLAAALGLASVTAHQGFELIGVLHGRRIAVTGAGGGVGSAGVALAAAKGAEVIAVVHDAARAKHLRRLGAAEVIDDVATIPVRTLDGVLDTGRGVAIRTARRRAQRWRRDQRCRRGRGRTNRVLGVGAHPTCNADRLFVRESRRTCAEARDGRDLCVASGRAAHATPVANAALDQAAEAHRLLENGGAKGRILLIP